MGRVAGMVTNDREYLELAKDIPRLRAHNMTAWAGRRKAGAEKIEEFKKVRGA